MNLPKCKCVLDCIFDGNGGGATFTPLDKTVEKIRNGDFDSVKFNEAATLANTPIGLFYTNVIFAPHKEDLRDCIAGCIGEEHVPDDFGAATQIGDLV